MCSPEQLGSAIHLSRLSAEYIRMLHMCNMLHNVHIMTSGDGGIGGVCFLFVEGDKKAKLKKKHGNYAEKELRGHSVALKSFLFKIINNMCLNCDRAPERSPPFICFACATFYTVCKYTPF